MNRIILILTLILIAWVFCNCSAMQNFEKTEIWVEPPKIEISDQGEIKVGSIHGHVKVTPKPGFLQERK